MLAGKSPKKNSQFKVWHLYTIVAVLFLGVSLATGANYLLQEDTDRKFETLTKTGAPAVAASAKEEEAANILGSASPTACSPCLKKNLNNQAATFSAQAVLLGDLGSGETFAVKQEKALLPIASLTKIMTALTVRGKLVLSDAITVPEFCTILPEG